MKSGIISIFLIVILSFPCLAAMQEDSGEFRQTMFTGGEHHANVLVRELYIDPACLNAVTKGRKLTLIYSRRKPEFNYNSIVIAETDSKNKVYEENKFLAVSDRISGMVTFQGTGAFAPYKCCMLVDWNTAWKLNEADGNVKNGELHFMSDINTNYATKSKYSPTLALYTGIIVDSDVVAIPASKFDNTTKFPFLKEKFASPAADNNQNTSATAADSYIININSQNDFNGLDAALKNAIKAKKKLIRVVFNGGTFFFKQNSNNAHIRINYDCSNVEIDFVGNGSTIIGESSALQMESRRKGYYVYKVLEPEIHKTILVDDNGRFVTDFYGDIHEMKTLVQPQKVKMAGSNGTTTTALKIPNTLGKLDKDGFDDMYIQVYADYYSQIYKVVKTTSDTNHTNLYFLPTAIEGTYNTGNNNGDWPENNRHRYNKRFYPCFRMINNPGECPVAYYKSGKLYSTKENVHLCNATRFLSVETSVKALSVSGFKFMGNKCGEGNSEIEKKGLISITSGTGKKHIHDCEFHNIRSTAIYAANSQDICIQNNKFGHYYKSGIYFDGCTNSRIIENEFSDGNLRHSNDGSVVVHNSECHIAHNKLTNYGYMGIGVGTWHKAKMVEGRTIIVEFNELYMTPEYRKSLACVPLFDGGAIYTWTKNSNTIIRHNFISGHSGGCDNRGIFCDDGTFNVKLYGNMIINTKNSYSIDLRYVDTRSKAGGPPINNLGNVVFNNIVDGICRYEDNAEATNQRSIKGRNLVLTEKNTPSWYNKFQFFNDDNLEADNILTHCKIGEQEVTLPSRMRGKLQGLGLSNFILSHFRYEK